MKRLVILGVLVLGHDARAEWPCADNTHYRVARSTKGDKPIAIAATNDKPVFGDFTFVELNNDGKPDLIFRSACIQGPADSVRLHRVFASCGPAADHVDELVMIFEEEELCARTVAIATEATSSKASGVLWQDLQLTRTTTSGKTCEQATQPLRFDGTRYQSGARTTRPCPAKKK